MMTLGACGTSGSIGISRDLPAKPTFVKPVEVDEPKGREHAVDVIGRERAGRIEANNRLNNFGAWYDQLREQYRGPQ